MKKRVSCGRVCAAAAHDRPHSCKIHILGGAAPESPQPTAQARPPHGRLTTVDATGWCGGGRVAGVGGFDQSGQWPRTPPPSAPHAPPGAPRPLTKVGRLRRLAAAAVDRSRPCRGGGHVGRSPRLPPRRLWPGEAALPATPPAPGPQACRRALAIWDQAVAAQTPRAAAGTVGWPKLVVAARPQSSLGSRATPNPRPQSPFFGRCLSIHSLPHSPQRGGQGESLKRTAGSHPLAAANTP